LDCQQDIFQMSGTKKKHIFHTVRLGNACAFWIVVHPFLCTKNDECTNYLYKLYGLRRRIQLFFPNMPLLPSKQHDIILLLYVKEVVTHFI